MAIFTHCLDCGTPNEFHPMTQRCRPCGDKHRRRLATLRAESIRNGTHKPRVRQAEVFRDHNNIAHALVSRAISYGFLLPAADHLCVDCGAPATAYDHRDYNKPLEVEPVCTGCNNRRGPGIPLVLPAKKSA